MNKAIRTRLSGLIDTIIRYPLTAGFLLAAAVLTAAHIGGADGLVRLTMTCAAGAAAGVAAQSAFERFFKGPGRRGAMYAAALVVTALFYLTVSRVSDTSAEMLLRGFVSVFTLWIAFIWLAVAGGRHTFSESFMASFKALFQAGFFSGVLFLGCAAIIAAIDRLIVPIDAAAYSHTANIVFVLVAPLLFLSLIPVFPGRGSALPEGEAGESARHLIEKRTGCPRFLEVLLSYIVIPLIAVFTVVLLVYILLNIGHRFWTDNLLEPLLISYSVAVIAVTLLTGRLENRFAVLFKKIFPKVLIPIALFQTIASILLMADTGLTYTRYYVILYGLFAVISGFVLSTVPMKRSGTVAAVLIVLSALSLVPPTDAFTLSRFGQIKSMEYVLRENRMLADNKVIPGGALSDADKAKIVNVIQYLEQMDQLNRVKWLPAGFNGYDDTQFFNVFGFHMYTTGQPQNPYISVYYSVSGLVDVAGYDAFTQVTLPSPDKNQAEVQTAIGGRTYTVFSGGSAGTYIISVKDDTGAELIRFDPAEIFRRYASFPGSKNTLTEDEATFTAENDAAALKLIVENAGFSTDPGSKDQNAQLLVFVKIKL